ncbi:DUF4349 domain-containing protein [Chloroflexus sp.]|uniref:DUF4349 domain-containing protein n=1 Tax=Chloroflexus sp. TaxID=1904827 RepID=UPI002ACECB90|nr:DUF4349 domain-containing protein [Chloroflexus sp.]
MARLVMIVLVVAAFGLAACGAPAPAASPQQSVTSVEGVAAPVAPPQGAWMSGGPSEAMRAEAVVPASNAAVEAGGGNAGDSANAPAEGNQLQYGLRMVILNANLVIEVASVDQAEAKLRDAVDRVGGYILRVSTTGEGDQKMSYVSFRVPFEQFERVLADVEGVASRVISRTVDGEDVTEQYVDLASRLRNLEATHARLTALLERAGTLDETLRLNQEISAVQGQIEQVKGRMRYLEQNTNYSTITVELRPIPPVPTPEPPKDGWDPGKVLREQVTLLLTFVQNILNFLIVLGVWLPVWIIPVLLLVWLIRMQPRAWQAERKSAYHPAGAETKRVDG